MFQFQLGYVGALSSPASHPTEADFMGSLAYGCHHDRNCGCGSLSGESGAAGDSDNHIRSKPNQLCCQFVQCLCLTFCKSIVEGDVLPFYVSQFMQSVVQCLQKLWKARRRRWMASPLERSPPMALQ